MQYGMPTLIEYSGICEDAKDTNELTNTEEISKESKGE